MPPPTIVIPLVVSALLAAFYLWMFWAMATNRDLTTSPLMYIGVAVNDRSPATLRLHWTMAFLFCNVVAAALYYLVEFRRT